MKKITLILITLFAFIYANAQYTVPRALPYKDTRWVENTGVAGASYLFDSIVMFRNIGDTQMKPLYPAMGYLQNFGGDSTLWIWDMIRWKKLTTGSSSSASNNTNLGAAYRWLNETSQGIKTVNKGFGIGLDSLTTGEIRITADTSKLPTRYTIDSLGSLIGGGTLTNITGTNNYGFEPIVTSPTASTRDIQVSTLLTLGSVPFIGTNGALRQNNANFFWDSTNKRLGILTNTPTKTFSVGSASNFTVNDSGAVVSDVTAYSGTHREYIWRSYLTDAGLDQFFVANSTQTNSHFSPVFGGYLSSVWDAAALAERALTSATNDAGTIGMIGISAAITDNPDDPNNGTFTALTTKPILTIGNAGTILFTLKPTGILNLSHYPNNIAEDSVLSTDVNGNLKLKLITASSIGSGAALTKTDDANVTLTLGGTPTTALLAATSLTLGWTGQLSVARGGTGQSSYTDGQLLIGNTSGNTLTKATLTAGTGISVTNGNGSITIAATGTGGTDTVNVSNVLAYGADSTGVVDATAAFNNAVNASTLNGKFRVYIPHGTYKITVAALKAGSQVNKQGIQLVNNIEIFGDGVGKTTIKAATATGDTSTTNWYPVFNGFTGSISNVKIHDLSVNGNQANIAIYSANPYTNPTGHNDTSKHYSVQGIYFKDGNNNLVYNTKIDSCQGFGVEFYNAPRGYIYNSTLTTNGNGGVGYTTGSSGTMDKCIVTNNNSDNIRVVLADSVNVLNSELAFSQSNASATNWFAGIYIFQSKNTLVQGCFVHDNSAYGIDNGSDSTYKGMRVVNNYVYHNGNGGIIGNGYSTITGNHIFANGKKQNGSIDTKSNYNPGAIVVNNSPNMVITNNIASDTTSGVQTYFIKTVGSPAPSFGFMGSIVTNNIISGVADTAHAYDGNAGGNSIVLNTIRTSAGALVNPAADNKVLTLTNSVPVWASASASTPINTLLAATGTNTIDNTAYKQEWQWSTLAGTDALKLSSTSTAAASNAQTLLNIALSGVNGTSAQTTKALSVSNTHTGTTSTNVGIYTTATGGATANWGLQADAPGVASTVTGGIQLLNSTASTSGATVQMSPTISLLSHAWKSNATAADQTAEYYFQNLPATGAAQITSVFSLQFKRNGAAATTVFSVSDLGAWNFPVVSGNPTFQFGNGYTAMAGNSTTTTYGLSLGPAGTVGWLNLSGSFTTAATAMIGINNNPILSGSNPGNASPSYGIKSIPATNSSTNYTTVPTDFIGVSGNPQYATGATAVVFPIVTGVEGAVTLASGINVNTTLARGFHSFITGAANPTGKAVTWVNLDIDSADNNHYTTNNYPIRQFGTNATTFFAGKTLIGWNGSATPAVSSTKIIFQVQGDNTKGSIPAPRMTNTQRDAISSPDEGLLIYSTTDHDYEFYNGTVWKTITTN